MKTVSLLARRSPREWLLCLEALSCLLWARILVSTRSFPRLARGFGQPQSETTRLIAPADRAVAVKVSWAVQAVARHLPLGLVCLPQAIAAQWMLRRRGLPTTLYFGVASNPAKQDAIEAHAWLRAGDKIVTGEEGVRRHHPVEWFADNRPHA